MIAAALGLLAACEEAAPGSSRDTTPPAVTHTLNPPAWILGTWSDCNGFSDLSWTFEAHNVVAVASGTTLNYAEHSKVDGVSVSESHGSDWYSIEATAPTSGGGTLTTRNHFTDDQGRIQVRSTIGGATYGPLPLCM